MSIGQVIRRLKQELRDVNFAIDALEAAVAKKCDAAQSGIKANDGSGTLPGRELAGFWTQPATTSKNQASRL